MTDTLTFHKHARNHPELGTEPIPVEAYTSAAYFEKEREAIFKRCWINVGRVEQLAQGGSFFVRDIDVCKASLLIVKGKDKVIRGFHNVCTHRGNTLISEKQGRRSLFTCKFHCWSFDDKGCLRRVTDEQNFHDLDKSKLGLSEVATDVWNGFIFVCFNPEQSLKEYLGGVVDYLADYPFGEISTRYTYKADERVNWKVLLDAQQEGYHVPYLHHRTISSSFEKDLEYFRSNNFQTFGPHRVQSLYPSDSFEPTKVGSIVGKFGSTSTDALSGINRSDSDTKKKLEGPLVLCIVFPNLFFGLSDGTYFSYNIWPLEVDRTIWEVHLSYQKPEKASQVFCNEYGKCVVRDTLLEDGSTHELVQKGLASGAIDFLQLQDEEILARHNYRAVTDMVDAYYS